MVELDILYGHVTAECNRSREQRTEKGGEKGEKKRRKKKEFDSEENVFLGATVSCLSMVAIAVV